MDKPLTSIIRPGGDPPDLRDYRKTGGYEALSRVLRSLTPPEVIEEVKASRLLGRGGAGFPTGTKWGFVPVPGNGVPEAYLVCNADEMEPGTFKDRYLMEGNPHQLIEGMIIAAFAINAGKAYIFLRWAYKKAELLLKKAIQDAYEQGYLGKNILGSGFGLEIYVHTSAGRYICGEETALLNSLEGKRAIPRTKPPFPTDSGLFGRPTVINNVETLSCIPHIMLKGAEWFRSLSRTVAGGTKLYGVSGKVNKPGLWELPLGISAGEILDEYAGGMMEGYAFRGLLPGGASTGFLMPEHLGLKLDFSGLESAGSRLGTGTMIVLDDKTCPVAFIHNIERFFATESCGWCTPCREGLPWTEKLLASVEEGKAKMEYLDQLEFLCGFMSPGNTFCAHAPGAVEPLRSGLKYFHDDFVNHIENHKCPWK
jgi:NADH-quinone oxidoreductase subunit F